MNKDFLNTLFNNILLMLNIIPLLILSSILMDMIDNLLFWIIIGLSSLICFSYLSFLFNKKNDSRCQCNGC